MSSLSPPPDRRRERLADLVASRFASLVGTARGAGAGADAEDVVQDVVTRFLEHGRELPEQSDALVAYLRRSVARDSARRRSRRPEELSGEIPDPAPDVVDALEDRRRVRAYARALERLPEDVRPVLLLDVAGVDRASIARRTGRSERSVKRVLAEHTGAVLARVVADVDGTACVRLASTLDALAANGWRPRPDGETARHLEVCDACRLGYLEARRTRVAVGSVLLLPAVAAREATIGVVLRTFRSLVHARRAVLLPAVASVSAIAPLVAFPHVDRLPARVARPSPHAARPRAAAFLPATVEAPLRHPVRRLATRIVLPPAHPAHRRVVRRTHPAITTTVRRTVAPPVTPTAPPRATGASASSCAFGSATIGC